MATIGKDGKDGKDDAGKALGFQAMELSPSLLSISPERKFYRVIFSGLENVPRTDISNSGRHWNTALSIGDLDSYGPIDNNSGFYIVVGENEEEITNIAVHDPITNISGVSFEIKEFSLQ